MTEVVTVPEVKTLVEAMLMVLLKVVILHKKEDFQSIRKTEMHLELYHVMEGVGVPEASRTKDEILMRTRKADLQEKEVVEGQGRAIEVIEILVAKDQGQMENMMEVEDDPGQDHLIVRVQLKVRHSIKTDAIDITISATYLDEPERAVILQQAVETVGMNVQCLTIRTLLHGVAGVGLGKEVMIMGVKCELCDNVCVATSYLITVVYSHRPVPV